MNLPEDCYTELMKHTSSDTVSTLGSVCQSLQKAVENYIQNHQWYITPLRRLTQIREIESDYTINQRLASFVPTPVSDGLFYQSQPLTEYHVKKLNEFFEDIEYTDEHNMELPDTLLMKDIVLILEKELTRVGFKVEMSNFDFEGDSLIPDKDTDIIFASERDSIEIPNDSDIYVIYFTDEIIETDPSYLELLKCPTWVHVTAFEGDSDYRYRIPKSRVYQSMRLCDGNIYETESMYIPLPPLIYKAYYFSEKNWIPRDFNFVGLTWKEIAYACYSGFAKRSTKTLENIFGDVLKKTPVTFHVDGYNFANVTARRTDIPPNNKPFWILVDPHAKPDDKPLIVFEDPMKDKIKLSTLLSILHNTPRRTQAKIIEKLIGVGMLVTIVPLKLLSLSDEELINKLNSPLLKRVVELGQETLFPRILFLYDSLPMTGEIKTYLRTLSEEMETRITSLNVDTPLVTEIWRG